MCGIFGIVCDKKSDVSKSLTRKQIDILLKTAERRGKDSSGFLGVGNNEIKLCKRDLKITETIKNEIFSNFKLIFGHSRLITNGLSDNQPLIINDCVLIHNGIIINHEDVFSNEGIRRQLEIDSEALLAIYIKAKLNKLDVESRIKEILGKCSGTISSVIFDKEEQSLILFSNNGSLYIGNIGQVMLFASELYPLKRIGCNNIKQVLNDFEIIDLKGYYSESLQISIDEQNSRKRNIIPQLGILDGKEKLLKYDDLPNLKRCSKCILPETMPFIDFDTNGVCNYCRNYKKLNTPKPISEFENILSKYRRKKDRDCIIPFSGGRDSCFGLHLAVKELGMKPITYTYDWGMVTDLARRNISRMCSILGVENIVVADNIEWKRENVRKNIVAWLNNPDLGMVNIFTAGDKHFFRHVEQVKKETGIPLDLWSINPLEVTHFKAGFLGVKPNFIEDNVYTAGWRKQLNYQKLRFNAMLKSPRYFNRSIYDTLLGEYYRSFHSKKDYYHIFDYFVWNEEEVNNTIIGQYDFELSPDTTSTWRIGDGTAAFYNYIYYTVAGFSEHDTFRSNQIREGHISREKALELVKIENQPRYQNIVWYLEAVNLDYKNVINRINNIEKIYKS